MEFGYAPPRLVDNNLWEVRGEWRNKLGRRMTIVRLSDNRLILHSSIQLKPKDLEWLKSLGHPAFIVAPNKFHCSDAEWMNQRFPNAELFVPESKIDFFSHKGLNPKNVQVDFPQDFSNEVKCIPMLGTRMEEVALVHRPSKTLILCDLAFNMGDVFSGIEKFLMSWNKIGGQFGPSRLTKLVFTSNRKRLIESYRQLLTEPFDRVIVNHGEILESQGKAQLKLGIQKIFGKVLD